MREFIKAFQSSTVVGLIAVIIGALCSPFPARSQNTGFGAGNGAKPITALLATPVVIKAAPGDAVALLCYNPNASVAYVQFYDSTGTVTPGTTANKFFVPLPASTTTLVALNVNMFVGNQVAATTSPVNGTAPGTALPCTVLFK